jgi:hypothetical protein
MTRDVTARPAEAGDEAQLDGIATAAEDAATSFTRSAGDPALRNPITASPPAARAPRGKRPGPPI